MQFFLNCLLPLKWYNIVVSVQGEIYISSQKRFTTLTTGENFFSASLTGDVSVVPSSKPLWADLNGKQATRVPRLETAWRWNSNGLKNAPNVCGKHVNQGREPWSSGYGKRLTFRWLWVQIPAPYTGWTFFHIYLWPKINEKEAGVGPFF